MMDVKYLTPDEYADMCAWLAAAGESDLENWPGWAPVVEREARIAQEVAKVDSSYRWSWTLAFQDLTASWRKDFDAWRAEHPTNPLAEWSGWTQSKSERGQRSGEVPSQMEPGFYWYQEPGRDAEVVFVKADGEVHFSGNECSRYLPGTAAGRWRDDELPRVGVFSPRLIPPTLC